MLALYLMPFYLLLNAFMLIMMLKWLGRLFSVLQTKIFKIPFSILFIFCTFSIGIAFLLSAGKVQMVLKYLGNIWIGADGIFMILSLMIGLILLIIFLFRKRRGHTFKQSWKSFCCGIGYKVAGSLICLSVVVGTCYGIYHGRDIQIQKYEVNIDKDGGDLDSVRAVLIGDIHMGYNVGVKHVQQMVDKINELNPDIILIAGDIFDNEYEALDDPEQLISILKTMQSEYGVYSVYGNHDIQEKILAGFTFPSDQKKQADDRMDAFIEAVGWNHLRDEAVLIEDSFYIIGRADEERPGKGIEERASIETLMDQTDSSKPVFVLDHEPKELQEQSLAGVDLCLNGHVHDGQVFPGNLLMKLLWENSCGYKKINDMHSIVTSGVGVWGPPIRIGTNSEICEITIHFN